jgi:hypothetical protein
MFAPGAESEVMTNAALSQKHFFPVLARPQPAAALCVRPKKYWWSQNIPQSPNISTLWGYTL